MTMIVKNQRYPIILIKTKSIFSIIYLLTNECSCDMIYKNKCSWRGKWAFRQRRGEMMATKFVRTPIGVEALFLMDGSFVPKKLWYNGKSFEIIRVVRERKYSPWQVRAIATTEYTVLIDDAERQIYYEPESNRWFSIKEVER